MLAISVSGALEQLPPRADFSLNAVWRAAISLFMHFMSPPEENRYSAPLPADRWVLPQGLGPDELAAELTAEFWDRLRFFAMRRLRDAALAEDVAQETLRRTLEALRGGRIEKLDALPGFLFETARHVCMHKTRSSGREAKAFQRFAVDPDEPQGPSADPLSELITDERCEEVRRGLARLEE